MYFEAFKSRLICSMCILGNEVLLMQRNSKQQHMGDTRVCLLNCNHLNLPLDAKGKKKNQDRMRLNQV